MAHAWMPEARRIRAEADGGPLGGGAPRAVWLTLGSPAGAVSVQSAAQRLIGEHRPCHLIWDPDTGETAQLISVLRAGRALGGPDRLDWVPNRARRRPENVTALSRSSETSPNTQREPTRRVRPGRHSARRCSPAASSDIFIDHFCPRE